MTREEAIADIRDNIKPVVGGISLDMAIKSLEAWEKVKKEIKQMRIHYGYLDVQGMTIMGVLEIIDKHLSEVENEHRNTEL